MNLISWEFAAFVAAALIVYYVLPGRFQNAWLVIASYAFYATLGWQFALVLVAVTLANYLIAQRIEASHSPSSRAGEDRGSPASVAPQRRTGSASGLTGGVWLWIGIVL